MKKIGIVFSREDKASVNVLNIVEKRKEYFLDSKIEKDVEIVILDSRAIFIESLNIDSPVDFYIFVSKHSSKAEKKSLLVHSVGNWAAADMGGNEEEVGYSYPLINKFLFKNLYEKYESVKDDLEDHYDVSMEATHHGPGLDKPVVFIEIGSTESEWEDKRLGEIIFEVLKKSLREYFDFLESGKDIKTLFAVGGLHYAANFNNIQKFNDEFAIGHICPKYYLENLDENMIREVMKKTVPKLDGVVLDTKALSGQRKRLVDIFEKLDLDVYKYKELKIEKEL